MVAPAVALRFSSAIPSALLVKRRGGSRVDRPADHAAAVDVEHDGAVDAALAGGVLGDVGDPQLVGAAAGELAVDQVAGGGRARRRPCAWAGRCARRCRLVASAARPWCGRRARRGRAPARRAPAARRRPRRTRRGSRAPGRSARRGGCSRSDGGRERQT